MDPALRELVALGSGHDILEATLRLHAGHLRVPPGVVQVARFGDIRTVRVRRDQIERIWRRSEVASLKAPRVLQLDAPQEAVSPSTERAPRPRLAESGRGVVFGCVDWGFDVGHPAFRETRRGRRPGASRVLALWDQRAPRPGVPGETPEPYGYGRVLRRKDIDRALRTRAPYEALDYHPGDADRGAGAHGTHVASIAAGSPRPDGEPGVAPNADLVFVHLASGPLGGLADLGDSVRILEAVDFIVREADGRPVVINLSVGRHGGAHTGGSLVERAFDQLVQSRPGITIVQSAGNYGASRAHASGRLQPGDRRELGWQVRPGGAVHDELEVWYSNRDRFDISLRAPGTDRAVTVALREARALVDESGAEVGRVYHRAFDPNTPDHHIDVLLRRRAPGGLWTATLIGREIADGRFGAWIERDPQGRRGQSSFRHEDVDPTGTIGSIANTYMTITVSAADTRGPFVSRARFASQGPTRDGRSKPDLMAPGVRIRGARSTPRRSSVPMDLSTSMSGASQAAPYVAGIAALCQEAAEGQLDAHDMRRVLVGTGTSLPLTDTRDQDSPRLPDAAAAVAHARLLRLQRTSSGKADRRVVRRA